MPPWVAGDVIRTTKLEANGGTPNPPGKPVRSFTLKTATSVSVTFRELEWMPRSRSTPGKATQELPCEEQCRSSTVAVLKLA